MTHIDSQTGPVTVNGPARKFPIQYGVILRGIASFLVNAATSTLTVMSTSSASNSSNDLVANINDIFAEATKQQKDAPVIISILLILGKILTSVYRNENIKTAQQEDLSAARHKLPEGILKNLISKLPIFIKKYNQAYYASSAVALGSAVGITAGNINGYLLDIIQKLQRNQDGRAGSGEAQQPTGYLGSESIPSPLP